MTKKTFVAYICSLLKVSHSALVVQAWSDYCEINDKLNLRVWTMEEGEEYFFNGMDAFSALELVNGGHFKTTDKYFAYTNGKADIDLTSFDDESVRTYIDFDALAEWLTESQYFRDYFNIDRCMIPTE